MIRIFSDASDEAMDVEEAVEGLNQLKLGDNSTRSHSSLLFSAVTTHRPFPLTRFDPALVERVLGFLHSPDRLALTSTCRALYRHRLSAYSVLSITSSSTVSLLDSLRRLLAVLENTPAYSAAARELLLRDLENGSEAVAPSAYLEHVDALDKALSTLLTLAPCLTHFLLDLTPTRRYNPLPRTLTQLLAMRAMHSLALYAVQMPSYSGTALAPPSSFAYAPAFERIVLDVARGEWLLFLLDDPRRVRWLRLRVWNPDVLCARVVQHLAAAAVCLHTLVVCTPPMHLGANAAAYSECLAHGFATGALANLRAFSLEAVLVPHALEHLVRSFAFSRLTHLRLVVKYGGAWLPDFGPAYVLMLARLVPTLRELALDQTGMHAACALPGGDLDAWGAAFRQIPHLHTLALAALFVLDLHAPLPFSPSPSPSLSSLSSASGSSRSRSPSPSPPPSPGPSAYTRNFVELAAWADAFLDEHLRLPAPFAELWFLDARAIGFRQLVVPDEEEGQEGRMRFMAQLAAREGPWWWEDWAREV